MSWFTDLFKEKPPLTTKGWIVRIDGISEEVIVSKVDFFGKKIPKDSPYWYVDYYRSKISFGDYLYTTEIEALDGFIRHRNDEIEAMKEEIKDREADLEDRMASLNVAIRILNQLLNKDNIER